MFQVPNSPLLFTTAAFACNVHAKFLSPFQGTVRVLTTNDPNNMDHGGSQTNTSSSCAFMLDCFRAFSGHLAPILSGLQKLLSSSPNINPMLWIHRIVQRPHGSCRFIDLETIFFHEIVETILKNLLIGLPNIPLLKCSGKRKYVGSQTNVCFKSVKGKPFHLPFTSWWNIVLLWLRSKVVLA